MLCISLLLALAVPPNGLNQLHAYAGSWKVSRKGADKPDQLVNECASAGQYYACQQSVNGSLTGLLLFIATETPGKFITQTIAPNGRATGAGEMQIASGAGPMSWVFSSSWNNGSRKILYRTTNRFVSKDRIQFQQEESDDGGKSWKTTGAGEDIRSPGNR